MTPKFLLVSLLVLLCASTSSACITHYACATNNAPFYNQVVGCNANNRLGYTSGYFNVDNPPGPTCGTWWYGLSLDPAHNTWGWVAVSSLGYCKCTEGGLTPCKCTSENMYINASALALSADVTPTPRPKPNDEAAPSVVVNNNNNNKNVVNNKPVEVKPTPSCNSNNINTNNTSFPSSKDGCHVTGGPQKLVSRASFRYTSCTGQAWNNLNPGDTVDITYISSDCICCAGQSWTLKEPGMLFCNHFWE